MNFLRFFPFNKDFELLARLVRENIRQFIPQYALALACMGIVAATTGLSAWMMKDLINRVFVDRDQSLLFVIPLAVFVLYSLKGFASYGQEILLARIGNNVIAQTQQKLFDSLIRQDISFFQTQGSSNLVTRITFNAQAAASAMNLIATSLGRDLFTVISLIIVMLSQDAILTAFALIGVPLLFLGVSRLLKQIRKLFTSEVQSMASIVSAVQETTHGIRVIKSFGLESLMRDRVSSAIKTVERLSNRMVAVQAGVNPLIDTLGGISVAGVILYGGWRVVYKGGTPGEFFAFITALLMSNEPARRLARLHLGLAGSVAGVRMMYDLIDAVPPMRDVEDATTFDLVNGAIHFSHVTFGYEQDSHVLEDFNITIAAKSTTALVGLSGSGKSTIFNLILRFWAPSSGHVLIDGQDIAQVTSQSLYDNIALVGQDVFLFSGTILENIRLGRPDASEEEVFQAAKAAAAHDFILKLPNGYDSQVGEFGGQLSGGQRQRISIARAFLKNAPIILLDEPTSALDAESDAAIQDALSDLMKNRTTLIIAHRLSTVVNADRIYVLDQGKIAEEGSHSELLANNGLYARLHQLQHTPLLS
jgi:ATP-binding cassette, subfamily B, bacterial MsbA